ncbi:unnamed protein product [Acanthoscelides obtectus]|uniref:Uncharacterized protein n=1 Tax=Acanthoscelides obtectus TaxID=200917 RepID=A0A9P0KQH3_ACAOB|nr:unnamed protein product [Acanthoscelides obtectus]CAK1635582.1 hypothetical protein AOBTE_LOCUS9369 [Acanthoscelides obtectus]
MLNIYPLMEQLYTVTPVQSTYPQTRNFRSINTLLQPFTRKWRNDLTGKCNKRLFQLHYVAAPNKTRILKMNFILIYATPWAQSNIPRNKLEQPAFGKFLEKYCNRHIPNESTLRKNYTSIIEKVIEEVSLVPGEIGNKIRVQWESVLSRNPGYQQIKNVCYILRGQNQSDPDIKMKPSDIASLMWSVHFRLLKIYEQTNAII